MQRNRIFGKYSQKYDKVIYRLKIEGYAATPLFDEAALRMLRDNINNILGPVENPN